MHAPTEASQNPSAQLGRHAPLAIAVFALIGAALSVSLTIHYFDLKNGTGALGSLCNINATINCDAVAASPYAELLPGFPLAAFSGGWFVALALLALWAWGRSSRLNHLKVLLAMAVVGVLFSGAYLAIMMGVIGKLCLQCLGIDFACFLSLGFAILGLRHEQNSRPSSRVAETEVAFGTLFLSAAGAFALSVLFLKTFDQATGPGALSDVSEEELVTSVLSTAPTAAAVLPSAWEGYPSLGPSDAPITILEFSDFQCPYCATGAKILHALVARYPKQVRVVFRGFPLDASCNRFVKSRMHAAACEAAHTALCADKQGKFAALYETFFDNQERLAPGKLSDLVARAGLDDGALRACLEAGEQKKLLGKSIEDADQWGVQSTPTFFVNGVKVQGTLPLPVWSKIVERLLSKS